MIDLLANSIASEIFTPDGTTHPSMGMPHAQMVSQAYGYRTREWVGLTDEERNEITNTVMIDIWQVARAIESKLKEKNEKTN